MSLQEASDIANIAQLGLALVVAFGGSFLAVQYIRKMRPVWKRFAENVGREVAVISTEKQSMEHEADILKRVGFFKVKYVTADARNLNLVRGSVLLVIGYSPNSKVYQKTFKHAVDNGLPIIVFSGEHLLSDEDRAALKSYSFSSLCETDLRLVSDVFAVISTFPEGKS
jgi:hypothetical protein